MKKLIIASVCTGILLSAPLLVLPAGAINANDAKVDKRGYVSVSYTAEKEVAPDTVEISIAVKTDNEQIGRASCRERV